MAYSPLRHQFDAPDVLTRHEDPCMEDIFDMFYAEDAAQGAHLDGANDGLSGMEHVPVGDVFHPGSLGGEPEESNHAPIAVVGRALAPPLPPSPEPSAAEHPSFDYCNIEWPDEHPEYRLMNFLETSVPASGGGALQPQAGQRKRRQPRAGGLQAPKARDSAGTGSKKQRKPASGSSPKASPSAQESSGADSPDSGETLTASESGAAGTPSSSQPRRVGRPPGVKNHEGSKSGKAGAGAAAAKRIKVETPLLLPAVPLPSGWPALPTPIMGPSSPGFHNIPSLVSPQAADAPVPPATSTGAWTDAEHAAFVDGLKRFGRKWDLIATNMVPTRTAAQVQGHARSCLEDGSKPLSANWTEEEKAKFVDAYAQHGRNWTMIAQLIPTHSITQVECYGKKMFPVGRALPPLGDVGVEPSGGAGAPAAAHAHTHPPPKSASKKSGGKSRAAKPMSTVAITNAAGAAVAAAAAAAAAGSGGGVGAAGGNSHTPSLSGSSESCESGDSVHHPLNASLYATLDSSSNSPSPSHDWMSRVMGSGGPPFGDFHCASPLVGPPLSPDAPGHVAAAAPAAVAGGGAAVAPSHNGGSGTISVGAALRMPGPRAPAPLRPITSLLSQDSGVPLTPLTSRLSHLTMAMPPSPVVGVGVGFGAAARHRNTEPPNLMLPTHAPYSPRQQPKAARRPAARRAASGPTTEGDDAISGPPSGLLASVAGVAAPSTTLALPPPAVSTSVLDHVAPPHPVVTQYMQPHQQQQTTVLGMDAGGGSDGSELRVMTPGSRPVMNNFAFPTLRSGKLGLRIANLRGYVIASALMKMPRNCSGSPLCFGDIVLKINGQQLPCDVDAAAPIIFSHASQFEECIITVAHLPENINVLSPTQQIDS